MRVPIVGMPNAEYQSFGKRTHVRASHLTEALKSAMHYRHAQLSERDDTPSMMLGRAAHEAVLEPNLFAARRFDKMSAAARTAYTKADAIRHAVQKHPAYARQIAHDGALCEVSIFWQDEPTQLLCKARLDVLAPHMAVPGFDTGYIVDFKTARQVNVDLFAKDVVNRGYDLQLAHYMDAAMACGAIVSVDEDSLFLLATENDKPHGTVMLRVGLDWLERAQAWRRFAMSTIARAYREDCYDGYTEDTLALVLPGWAPKPPEIA